MRLRAHLGESPDESREARVHRALQRVLERLADARREAGGRDRDAHRPRFRDRRHRDEAVARLIDAAQQEAMAVGERAQSRRKRRVLRRRDDEERAGEVVVAKLARVVDAHDVRPGLAQRGLFRDRLAVVGCADHHAPAPVEIETDRKKRFSHGDRGQ